MPAISPTNEFRDIGAPDQTPDALPVYAQNGVLYDGNKSPVSGANPATVSGRRVIIGTDWWTDCDDVLAMRLALEAERIGVWDILALHISTGLFYGPRSLDALVKSAGRVYCPIGVPLTPHVPDGTPSYQFNMCANKSRIGDPTSCPDAVSLMRRALAAQPDASVEFIEIGYLNNLQELLQSPADSISPLTGVQLVAAKVIRLWCMAGTWPNGSENNFTRTAQSRAAGNYVCANWPTPITFLGYEIAVGIRSGGNMLTGLGTDIVKTAFADHGSTRGRSSWDPMLMLLAMHGSYIKGGYTAVQGTASVNASTGANTFTVGAGNHTYVVRAKPDEFYLDVINAFAIPNSARTTFPNADGTVWRSTTPTRSIIGGAQPTLPLTGVATDAANLMHAYFAADGGFAGNASTQGLIPDRVQGDYNLPISSYGAVRPTYSTSVGGKRAITHASGQVLFSADSWAPPAAMTMYISVYFAVAPTANQTVLASEQTSTTTPVERSFHLKATSSVACQAATFVESNGIPNDYGAAAMPTGVWKVMILRRTAATDANSTSSIQALLDGVGNGATASGPPDQTAQPFVVGARKADGSAEPAVFSWNQIRIYGNIHDSTTMAAVVAEMLAAT